MVMYIAHIAMSLLLANSLGLKPPPDITLVVKYMNKLNDAFDLVLPFTPRVFLLTIHYVYSILNYGTARFELE